jgi:hypothetical protein
VEKMRLACEKQKTVWIWGRRREIEKSEKK